MPKFVYDFTEGNKDLKDLLGGKGANLAEMTNLGLPVPPGFTITTEACRHYLEHGTVPEGLDDEVDAHLAALESAMGKKLGRADDPLLVSVRSGAKFSMPGMMETVLNIGLNDESRARPRRAGGRRAVRLGLLPPADPDVRQDRPGHRRRPVRGRHRRGQARQGHRRRPATWTPTTSRSWSTRFKEIVREQAGREFPTDPREQMDLAVKAVFDSWNADRAILYRRQERIPVDLGTAVNICSMVFGNLGMDSGHGRRVHPRPRSGQQGVYGDYLQNAQGEDVVAGIRNTVPLTELERIDKASYDRLLEIMETLENHYRDLCDIEFTIERGKLWMLQTRVGKRTAAAAFRIACQLARPGAHRRGRGRSAASPATSSPS